MVLCDLVYISLEQAVLHCSEPSENDLSVQQADRLSCSNQGGRLSKRRQDLSKCFFKDTVGWTKGVEIPSHITLAVCDTSLPQLRHPQHPPHVIPHHRPEIRIGMEYGIFQKVRTSNTKTEFRALYKKQKQKTKSSLA